MMGVCGDGKTRVVYLEIIGVHFIRRMSNGLTFVLKGQSKSTNMVIDK